MPYKIKLKKGLRSSDEVLVSRLFTMKVQK